jgi:signal transduction histidine kinase
MLDLAHRSALAIENAGLYQEARLAIEVRDEFLAVAGHELKTPLAALLLQLDGLTRMAGRDESDLRMMSRLEKAAQAGRRLNALITEMLDVTRITSGRLRLEPEPLNLDEVVREVVGGFRDQAARSQTAITLRLEPGVAGQWDRMRIEQLVANLVSNALKYGAGKPVLVQLTTAAGQAVLRVTDHGLGIERDQQRRIFERFERAVATREYGGFGLGLWIARQVAEASDGRIDVQSEPGQGATFTVTLPLATHEAYAPH